MENNLDTLISSLTHNTAGGAETVGPLTFLIIVLTSLISSVFISGLYLYFFQHRSTGSQIHRSFPLLGISITAIFICIQFSLPLSLGLLGALSIVRFRTPIKEPEEIGFIMLIIATSIACATFNFTFLLLLILIAVIGLLIMRFGPDILVDAQHDGILMITLDNPEYEQNNSQIFQFLEKNLRRGRLEGVNQLETHTVLSYSFTGLKQHLVSDLQQEIRKLATITDINIYFHRPGAL